MSGVAVILTALGLEYEAVQVHLTDRELVPHATGTLFEVGALAGTTWRVALAETGPGNRSAAVVTEHARQLFAPEALFFVGVAGAVKDDVELGDVVVATAVHAYHGGKDTDDGFLARPEGWQASWPLLQVAQHALRGPAWRAQVDVFQRAQGWPLGVHFKPIGAGDVVLNSPKSALREQLHRHYNDVVAVEMESAGMAHAAHMGAMRALTVRGISDRADGEKYPEADAEYQPRAAAHAAAAALAILRELPLQSSAVGEFGRRFELSDGARRDPVLPRVLDRDRASLAAYRLPPVARDDLLDAALRTRDRQQGQGAETRTALVLTGDGGIGKSVLLGQLLQRLEATPGAVVLVSCAQLSQEALSGRPAETDRALGEGVRPLDGLGITEILTRLRADHGHVTLLVDTLDLILDRRSLPGLSAVLSEALDIGDVVMTCRDHEYLTYLQHAARSAPRLAGRLSRFTVPTLSAAEIVRWARNYLTAHSAEPSASDAAFLRILEGTVATPGPLRQVCALPVRLAMACEVYAGDGHIPEDLTAVRLYAAYWDARVRILGGIDHPVKERAALALAERLVTGNGALTVRVPKGALGAGFDEGLGLLVSEGVVRSLNDRWEFFHQNFGEYAHGRFLLDQGLAGPGITGLAQALDADHTNLWPLARALLSQVEEYDDYRALAGRLPIGTPDAAQAQAVAALGRAEDGPLGTVLRQVEASPDRMAAILPVLGEAPGRHLGAAIAALVTAVEDHPAALGQAAIAAMASLLPRVPPDDMAARLTAVLTAACDLRGHLEETVWESVTARLPAALLDVPLRDDALAAVRALYPRLSSVARREAIRLHLAHLMSPAQTGELARCVLAVQCPPSLSDADAVAVMRRFWDCPEVLSERGWSSWRDLLAARLPRNWGNAQVKFTAELGARSESVCTEILDDILDGEGELTRHVNVLALLTEHHAEWIAAHVLAQPAPGRAGAGSLAHTMTGIDVPAETRLRLLEWLVPARAYAPKNVWPAQIVLAGEAAEVHRRIFDDLAAAKVEQPVVDSMLRAWVHAPTPVLAALADRLRPLLTEGDSRHLQTRARLEGRLAERDPQARQWLANALLHGASSTVAGTAIKTVRGCIAVYGPELTHWMVTLLDSPHTDAVMRVTTILGDRDPVDDAALTAVAATLPQTAIRRMRVAVRKEEDSNLIRQLLLLIIRVDELTALGRDIAEEVYAVTRARLAPEPAATESAGYSAALRDISLLCGSLLPGRFTKREIRELLTELLTAIGAAALGRKITDALAALLTGLGRRDPGALDWLEDLFVRQDLAPGPKRAIAKAVLNLDGAERGGRAARLRTLPGCPPEVATFILNALRSSL